jgi:murein DD-endopeptidase MepM/ murein hydrolase activator NlpD
MRRRRSDIWRAPAAAVGGFVAGAALSAVLLWDGGARAPSSAGGRLGDDCGQAILDTAEPAVDRSPREAAPASRVDGGPARIGLDPLADLRGRALSMPVENYDRTKLHGSFSETRGGSRLHEAIDILAPRDTSVVAVEDGTIARLFSSKAGGITIYHFDPSTTYVYYYAHLERYASGLREGAEVRRGQVIGYVGTSGNAPKDTPHLHFAIFRLTDRKQWWDGTPIDPFEVLR